MNTSNPLRITTFILQYRVCNIIFVIKSYKCVYSLNDHQYTRFCLEYFTDILMPEKFTDWYIYILYLPLISQGHSNGSNVTLCRSIECLL